VELFYHLERLTRRLDKRKEYRELLLGIGGKRGISPQKVFLLDSDLKLW